MFVMKAVSLPKCVKAAHLCVMLPGSWLGVAEVGCLGVRGLCVCVSGIHCSALCRGWYPVLLCILHVVGGRCLACCVGILRRRACAGEGGLRNMG